MPEHRAEVPTPGGIIRVSPVLFCAPVFWTPGFWTASAHAWDWVRPETPLDQKPWAELDVSLDVTLGEIFEVACRAWGIESGPDMDEYGGGSIQGNFHRFAFVSPDRDAHGVSEQVGYAWPAELPIPQRDGSIAQVAGIDVTYRELLVASSLGLIEGDITRPYVHPVMPQGDLGHAVTELIPLTIDAIQAAYRALDAAGYVDHSVHLVRVSHAAAGEVWKEGERYLWIPFALKALYNWFRSRMTRSPS